MTLVELLVVLAIIGVLAVVGFFGVRAAIAHSHNSSDAASLRQIYAAAQLYGADWDGQLTPIRLEKGVYGLVLRESPIVQLRNSLEPYVTENDLWYSRLDWRKSLPQSDPRRYGLADHAESSYLLSTNHWRLPENADELVKVRLYEFLAIDRFREPSRALFIFDILHEAQTEIPVSEAGRSMKSIRGDRFIRLMYDGSVEVVPWQKYWDPTGPQDIN